MKHLIWLGHGKQNDDEFDISDIDVKKNLKLQNISCHLYSFSQHENISL